MNQKIILGSGSPRRLELLKTIWTGEIEILKSDIEEVYPQDISLESIPLYLANLKAKDIIQNIHLDDHIFIAADTIVICDNRVLGKPIDEADAKAMLHFLANKKHRVITGVAIYHHQKWYEIEETTEVYFCEMSDAFIENYIRHYKPLDKAGSYGIQDFIGMTSIHKIDGCYYNVMGLPTSRVWKIISTLLF